MRKTITFIALFVCLNFYSFSQIDSIDHNNCKSFKSLCVNFSWVNFGIIDEWAINTNFDESRVYMHFSLGAQTNINNWLDLRLDILSNYSSILNKKIFSPSTFTLGTRFSAKNFDKILPYIDLKFGVAHVNHDEISHDFAFIPLVVGFRSGISYQVFRRVQFGFSFDNVGLLYAYKTYYPRIDDYMFTTGPFFDGTRMGFVTTDLIIQLVK